MSYGHSFRKQSIVAPPTETGVINVYANNSGYLVFVDSNATTGYAGASFVNNVSMVGGTPPATGVVLAGALAATYSGAYIGTTGGYAKPVFLAQPDQWLVVSAPSGGKYVVPGYLYT